MFSDNATYEELAEGQCGVVRPGSGDTGDAGGGHAAVHHDASGTRAVDEVQASRKLL